jgi:phage gp36-like protein
MSYWAQADLEDRVGAELVRQILDDDNSGGADSGPIARLQLDSDSYVEGALVGIYSLSSARLVKPNRLVQLSLDAAEMMLSRRRPESARLDWVELKKALDSDLDKIRKGVWRLDIETMPEPSAIQGGDVSSDDVDAGNTTEVTHTFLGGMGDY